VTLPSALHPAGGSGSSPASFDDFPHPSNKTQKPVTASRLAIFMELLCLRMIQATLGIGDSLLAIFGNFRRSWQFG
jgi:hypothetical protein